MREPKNAMPLRTARGNANASDAKEVHEAFMNAPANLKRKSETKVPGSAARKTPKIEQALPSQHPAGKYVEVRSKVDSKAPAVKRTGGPGGAPVSSGKEAPSARRGPAKDVRSAKLRLGGCFEASRLRTAAVRPMGGSLTKALHAALYPPSLQRSMHRSVR